MGDSFLKERCKAICQISTGKTKRRYRSMRNNARRAIKRAIREMADETLTELKNCTNWMPRLVKGL